MSVNYPLTQYDKKIYLNPYPNPTYTNHPFYISWPYYTNHMIYNYSPKDPFSYTYGLIDPKCRCDVYHSIHECIRKRNENQCP